jgi:hypothetical protein
LLFGSLEKDVALCSAVVKVNFADNWLFALGYQLLLVVILFN